MLLKWLKYMKINGILINFIFNYNEVGMWDCSDNTLTKLNNLACCPLLTSLNVANNHLKTRESIEHLKECPNLR